MLFKHFIALLVFCSTNSKEIQHYSTDNSPHCICVPLYLCADYDPLINGEKEMDVRIDNSECQNYFDTCCENLIEIPEMPVSSVSYDGCGSRLPIEFAPRITSDSSISEFGELPWTAMLMLKDKYRCGGSIIHHQVVMTAAHCVETVDKTLIIVRVGEWDTASEEEPLPHQDLSVEEVLVHPNFQSRFLRNDIALLFLREAMSLQENVNTICLSPQNFVIDNIVCTASGWGQNTFIKGKYSTVLNKVDLPLIDRQRCLTSLKKTRLGKQYKLDKSFICAGGEENKDTCKGDGGSPLVCHIPGESDRFFQIGIVAWGIGCGENETPGVYVNVPLFIDWIDEEITARNFDISFYKY